MTRSGEDEDRVTTEAARWLVALEDDPDDAALRVRFDAWLAASPANAAAWANTSDIYDMMGRVPPAHAGHWEAPLPHPLPPPRTSLRRRFAAGVVAAALAACLALVVMPALMLRMQADYRTTTAELRSIRLADGSTVRLGADSAIAVTLAHGERGVRLLKGEAVFEVTADPDRPFRVAAGEVETTVVGTAFEVRMNGEAVSVAVREGQVRVDYASAAPPVSERLSAGDWVQVGWTGHVERGGVPPGDVAAWLQGQIVARDRPMAEVVDELRRYYGGMIVLADGALGRERVTGVYNVADPVAALRAIAGAHGGSVRRISPWLLVVSGG
ncbi:MAG: DUF4880 domain-containing protein [Alphaproteobacteria bacterium]|nr:DUF4880 domain-containing protein [Alphaproteobacteria bacterium]